MPIFLCVTKDLSNRLIDMVLHRGEASHHSKLYQMWWSWYHHPPPRKIDHDDPAKKNFSFFYLNFLFFALILCN